jgi:hypothetical protein
LQETGAVPDTLVEAGYGYAEGFGCNKDMKCAEFYRTAKTKGVSMVDVIWIFKDQYGKDGTAFDARSSRSGRSPKKDNSEKKAFDKSRTRTVSGRMKVPQISAWSSGLYPVYVSTTCFMRFATASGLSGWLFDLAYTLAYLYSFHIPFHKILDTILVESFTLFTILPAAWLSI